MSKDFQSKPQPFLLLLDNQQDKFQLPSPATMRWSRFRTTNDTVTPQKQTPEVSKACVICIRNKLRFWFFLNQFVEAPKQTKFQPLLLPHKILTHCIAYTSTWVRDFQSLLADPIYTSRRSDIQTLAWTMPEPHQSPSNRVTFSTFFLPEARLDASVVKSGYTPKCCSSLKKDSNSEQR